MITRH